MKQVFVGVIDDDCWWVIEMFDDFNDLLDKYVCGEDMQWDFDEFMIKYGEFFLENLCNVEELLDLLVK